jgi:hypothetical protein
MSSLTQDFSENEDKDHANEESRLLSCASHTSITDNSNSEACRQTGQADGETSTKLEEGRVQCVIGLLQAVGDQDGHHQSVDTDDTGHNNGDDV